MTEVDKVGSLIVIPQGVRTYSHDALSDDLPARFFIEAPARQRQSSCDTATSRERKGARQALRRQHHDHPEVAQARDHRHAAGAEGATLAVLTPEEEAVPPATYAAAAR